MIRNLADIWVFSDMNGTLLNDSMQIAKADLECIRLFTMMGGRFSIATDRTVESIQAYSELFPYLSLSISSSGCVIRDFKTDFECQNGTLPWRDGIRVVWDIFRHFPHLGILVMGEEGKNFQVSGNSQLDLFFRYNKTTYVSCPLEELPQLWNKVLFTGSKEQLETLRYYVSKRHYLGIYFSFADPFSIEMLPKKVNKGSALQRVCEISGFEIENTIAIGDYYDDIDLFKTAGYAVSMENSPKDIKMATNVITGDNNESGVGQFLYKLVQTHGKRRNGK